MATADRSIILFDENGEKRDKFSTKPSGSVEGKTSYVIRALVFSPDSTSLAGKKIVSQFSGLFADYFPFSRPE